MSTNGTRWRDPDTGLIANPGNIDLARDGGGIKLGSYFDESLPAAAPPTAIDTTEADLKAFIKTHRPAALKGDVPAIRALELLRGQEYGRKDGGRLGIKRALALCGVGKPA